MKTVFILTVVRNQNTMSYYKEKILSLFDKLFLEVGDAKSRIINCENKIESAYWASKTDEVPLQSQNKWEEIYNELNSKKAWIDKNGNEISSSLVSTLKRKRNKSMKKYFHFFLEEFYRVL